MNTFPSAKLSFLDHEIHLEQNKISSLDQQQEWARERNREKLEELRRQCGLSEERSMSSIEGSRVGEEGGENAGEWEGESAGYSERIRGYEEYMKGEFGSQKGEREWEENNISRENWSFEEERQQAMLREKYQKKKIVKHEEPRKEPPKVVYSVAEPLQPSNNLHLELQQLKLKAQKQALAEFLLLKQSSPPLPSPRPPHHHAPSLHLPSFDTTVLDLSLKYSPSLSPMPSAPTIKNLFTKTQHQLSSTLSQLQKYRSTLFPSTSL